MLNKRIMRILLIFFLLISVPAYAVDGKVVKVTDGDTLTMVTTHGRTLKVRIFGIDAPERKQPYNKVSGDNVKALCADQPATLTIMSADRYGRVVAVVYCQGINVGLDQLSKGLAWAYIYYLDQEEQTPEILRYAEAEKEARENKRGLWQDKNPVNPYDWRHKK